MMPTQVAPQYATLEQYEAYVRYRQQLLSQRERSLLDAGRVPNYEIKRAVALSTLALGAVFMFASFVTLTNTEGDDDSRTRLSFYGLATGAAMTLGGGVAAGVLKGDNVYRAEVRQARAERVFWLREGKRVYRERRLQEHELSLSLNRVGFKLRF
jgi:hypothetical protein